MTPTTQVITRVLLSLGLRNRRTAHGLADFSVKKAYDHGEISHTYVVLYTRRANDLVAESAQMIEEVTRQRGYPFTVTVHTAASGNPISHISNH
jgi:hypothetical protein